MEEKILKLTQQDISLILTALSAGPYQQVAPLINKITSQSNGDANGSHAASAGSISGGSNPDHRLNGDHLARSKIDD